MHIDDKRALARKVLALEIEPVLKRAAAKTAKRYFVRLSRRRVICPEDLVNVGWVRVFEQLKRIARISSADDRAAYVYTLVCGAIHNEMAYIFTSGDDAVRLTPQGKSVTGAKDSSYDGGATIFGDDASAPTEAQVAPDYWTPPSVWDEWQTMTALGRIKLLTAAGSSEGYAVYKWNEIPFEDQVKIEERWKWTARGVLRENKHANGVKASNPFGFISSALPHPKELAGITPPRLRSIALLVYGGGFYSDRESINSGEISKIIGVSARTIHRDHAGLLKLWGRYIRASVDDKRDEKRFPRYPLHSDVREEFMSVPAGAQMPEASSPIVQSVMMSASHVSALYQRMQKYHTDFSEAAVTGVVAAPSASIYKCRPDPFNIIGQFNTRIGVSDGHTRTIDTFARKPSPSDPRIWIPIHCGNSGNQPFVWLHDWSDYQDLFGDKPRKLYLTTQRSTSVALYPRGASADKQSYCVCALCVELRRRDRLFFDESHAATQKTFGDLTPQSTLDERPLKRNALSIGALHNFSANVARDKYLESHFLGCENGQELWKVVQYFPDFNIYHSLAKTERLVRAPRFRAEIPPHIENPYPHDWSDTIEAVEMACVPPCEHVCKEACAKDPLSKTGGTHCLHASKHSGMYAGRVHRIRNPHVMDCSQDPMTAEEIAALYNKKARKEREIAQREFAADNERIRASLDKLKLVQV